MDMPEYYSNEIDLIMSNVPGLFKLVEWKLYFDVSGITSNSLGKGYFYYKGEEYFNVSWDTSNLGICMTEFRGCLQLDNNVVIPTQTYINLYNIFDTRFRIFIDEEEFDLQSIIREHTINSIIK